MESKADSIIQEISTFYLLKETYKRNNTPMQDFVLASEPPKALKRQHDLWQHLYQSKEVDYVDVSESEKIIDYAREHNVLPMSGDMDKYIPF